LLREWKKSDTKSVDNDILRQKESEDDRVQVMTMHASKGLEFPIVFLPAGFSKIKTGETIEEMERLLYVAITRAKYKIYLPWTKYWDDLQKCGLGSQKSPLNYGFLYTAIRKYLEQTPQNEQSVIDYDSTGIK